MNDTALPGFAGSLLATLGATALVALIAWIALALLRRVSGQGLRRAASPGRRAGRLRIVQTLPLGTRERAVLIADDEHEYLLGVAAGGVSLLVSREREATAAVSDEPGDGSGST